MNLLSPIEQTFDSLTQKYKPEQFYPVLLLILVTIGFLPLLFPGMPMGHDMPFHLERLRGLAEGLSSGTFPVLINHSALNGYGYATGLFYPDIFLYPTAFLINCGLGLVPAYKLFLFSWGIFNALSMYYAGRRIGGSPRAGFIAGMLYSWSSYLAVDIFIRSALGEVIAFPFVPLTILGAYELIYGDPKRFAPLALGAAGLILSHNITTLLTALILAVWFGCCIGRFLREPLRIFWTLIAGLFTLSFAASYLIPMFEQLRLEQFYLTTKTLTDSIAERAVPLTRLFLELPYMKLAYWIPSGIGIIFVITVCQRLRFKTQDTPRDNARDAMLIAGICSLLAASNVLPWEGMMKALAAIQFPWRFYLPATAFLALGGALTLDTLIGGDRKMWRHWFFILLCGCGFAWFFNTAYLYAAKIHEHKIVKEFKSAGTLAASGLHYLPRKIALPELQARGEIVKSEYPLTCTVKRISPAVLEIDFQGNTRKNTLELPLVGYYGYQAKIKESGKLLPVTKSRNSYAALTLPDSLSKGKIIVFYGGTALQKYSGVFSATAFLIFILLLTTMHIRRKHELAANN